MMKISDVGEFGLIDRIRKLSRRKDSSVVTGIGDDAAVMKLAASHFLLATTDLLLEGIHFDLSYTDYYSLGWKSAAVNLSDIGAMGATPRFCLTALGIPRKVRPDQVLEFYRGFNKLLQRNRTVLVGGDTCSSRREFFISVTVLGESHPSRIIRRDGARPGDKIFVTGTLGDSAAGMELLQSRVLSGISGIRARMGSGAGNKKAPHARLIERHLRPCPRVSEARMIADSGVASAMIDISDGLSSDLHHICEESGVGAEIVLDNIPLSSAFKRSFPGQLKRAGGAAEYALRGGEDYELLFTVPQSRVAKLLALKLPVAEIGTITRGRTMWLLNNGGRSRLLPQGYDHFKAVDAKKPINRQVAVSKHI